MLEKLEKMPFIYWIGVYIVLAGIVSIWITPWRVYVFGVAVIYGAVMWHFKEMSQWNWPVILTASLFFMIVLAAAVTYTGSWSYITGRAQLLEEQRNAAPAMPNGQCQEVLQILDAPMNETWHCQTNGSIAYLIQKQTQEFQGSDWSQRQVTALLGPNWDQQPWDVPALGRERTAYTNALSNWQNQRFHTTWEKLRWVLLIALALPTISGILRLFDLGIFDAIAIFIPVGVGIVAIGVFLYWKDDVFWDIVLLSVGIEIAGIMFSILATFIINAMVRIPVRTRAGYFGLMAIVTVFQSAATVPLIIVFANPGLNNIVSANVDMMYSDALITYIMGMFTVKASISLFYQLRWLAIGE